MPDVGLFSATEPLSKDMKVVIKYTVEVNGLPVYSETYDVEKLAEELKKDEAKAVETWSRRIKCVVACRNQRGFSFLRHPMPDGWTSVRLRSRGVRGRVATLNEGIRNLPTDDSQ